MNIFSNGINYADGETPVVMTTNIEAIGYEGWYYKNSELGKKITWFVPLGKSPFVFSDLTAIYASLHILNKSSLPYLVVYTAPIGFNDVEKWYHSKTVFSVPKTAEISENNNYCFFAETGKKMNEITIDGHTNIALEINTEKSTGKYTDINVVKYIAFCTNDDATTGEAEFILSDINIIKKNGDIELFLSNDELFSSINVNVDSLVLSRTDNRKSGIAPDYAFLNPITVTKVNKTKKSSIQIGHNGLLNDTLIDNFKLPRLANVAGKSESSVAVDNTNTIFNNFYVSLDFSVETNVNKAQFTIEAWGLDCSTRTKVFVDAKGNIKLMYRGVDLFSNGNVLPNDIILDENLNPTPYGWTTHLFPGTLFPGNWYRLVQTIHFSEELYGDRVNTRLYELSEEDGKVIDIILWDVVDNTWEAFYINHPSQAINGNMPPSVDSIQIHCCDAPRNTNIASIKNIVYSTSKTVHVSSFDELITTEKGIITYLAGNSTSKSIAAITGLQYLFEASGGYLMERGFNKIKERTQYLIQKYDVTDSVQVKLNAGLFNGKLGLIKDASNLNVVSSTFDKVNDEFPIDSITISSADFINNLTVENIISVGKYTTIYTDFISYVNKYFGFVGGFSSLFVGGSEFDISNSIFNADSFMSLITSGKKSTAKDISNVDTTPAMYYKMTSSNGNTFDEVTNDYTGIINTNSSINTSIAKWGNGALDGRLSQVNSTESMASVRYIVPGTAGMTFSFWVKNTKNDVNNNDYLFSLDGVFNMAIRGEYVIYPYINCTNGNYATTINYLNGFICGTWNYISLTIDPNGTWKYYLNGLLKQTVNITSTYAYGYPSSTTALRLLIGNAAGYYNEFLYYDRVLSSSEILNLYSMYTVDGMTISVWANFTSLDTTPRTIWSFYNSTNGSIFSLSATNTKYSITKIGSDSSNISLDISITPVINSWTHIAAVFDNGQSENTWTVYINNIPYCYTKDANNIYLPYVNLSNTANAIGMEANTKLKKMHGYIDEVTIYKSVLPASKINSLYNGYDTLCKIADYTFDLSSVNINSIANYASGTPIYDGTITNLSLITASEDAIGAGCLYFPNDYSGVVNLGEMVFQDQNVFSFSTWAKFSSLDGSGSSTVFSMYSSNSSISINASSTKYTFSIKNTKAPMFAEVLPIQNNNFTNVNHTFFNLQYPYSRNGTYRITTSATGFTSGNPIYSIFNTNGGLINTGNVYSAADGTYTGLTKTRLNLSSIDPANITQGIHYYSDSLPGYSYTNFTMAYSYTNILGIDIKSDGERFVFFVGTTLYWASRNPISGTIGTIYSLSTGMSQINSISITQDGSRLFLSANTPFAVYYSDWNGTEYTSLVSIYSSTTGGYISCNSNGTKLLLTAANTFNGGLSNTMKLYFAVSNGSTYDFSEIDSSFYYIWGSAISADGARIVFSGYNSNTTPAYVPLYLCNWNGSVYGSKIEIDYSSIPRTSIIKINRIKLSDDGRIMCVAVIGAVGGDTNLFYSVYDYNTEKYGIFYPLYHSDISSSFPKGNVKASITIRTIDSNTYEILFNKYQVSTVFALKIYFSGAVLNGEYVQMYFPFKFNITKYYLNSYSINYMPKTFYIIGSNDETQWDILSYKTNVSLIDNGLVSDRGVSNYVFKSQYYSYYRILVSQTNNTAAAYLYNIRTSGYVQESIDLKMDCNVQPTINTWNHIAGTLSNNGTNNTVKLYINNTPYVFTTDSNNVLLPPFGIDTTYTRVAMGMEQINEEVSYYDQFTNPLIVDQFASYTSIEQWSSVIEYVNKMSGYIDNTKFFNSLLSDTQINKLYNNQSIVENSLAKYSFNIETFTGGQLVSVSYFNQFGSSYNIINQFINYNTTNQWTSSSMAEYNNTNIESCKIANIASGGSIYDATLINTTLITSTGQKTGSGALYFPSTDYSGEVTIDNFVYDVSSINVVRTGPVWNYKFDVSQNNSGYLFDSTSQSYNMNNTNWTTKNSISSVQTAVLGGQSLKSNAGTTAVYYNGNPIYTIPKNAAMTFAFWIYIDSNLNNNGKGVIGISDSTGANTISMKISGTTSYNMILQTIFDGKTTTYVPTASIAPATWTYVCWTITTAGNWKYYINGALQQVFGANVKPFFSASYLYAASAYGSTGFYGYIDEYRYYERELSNTEILYQYNYYTINVNDTTFNDLSGSITISNINGHLRNAIRTNVFGNRTRDGDNGIGINPFERNNYGLADGFLDGDIIWVPAGTTIKLSVGVDAESFLPVNNIGPTISANFIATQDTKWGSGNFIQHSIATTTNISRTITAPLLIRVSNL